MEFKDYLAILKRHLILIFLLLVFSISSCYFFSLKLPKSYQASLSLLVKSKKIEEGEKEYYAIQSAELFTDTVKGWFKIPSVVAQIYEKANINLKISDLRTLSKKLIARKISSQTLEVKLKEKDKNRLENLAKAIIEVVKKKTAESGANFEILSYGPIILEKRSNIWLNLALSAILALFLSVLLAFLIEYFSPTVNFKKQVKEIFKKDGVSFYPKDIRKMVIKDSEVAERFRFLRSNLLPLNKKEKMILIVTCVSKIKEAPFIASNLALSIGGAGKKTILIDADFKNPLIHEIFGLKNQKGFSELLFDQENINSYLQKTPEENLKIISSGIKLLYASDTIARADLEKLKKVLFKEADIIVFHTPPVNLSSDTFPLFSLASKVLLIIKLGKSTIKGAEFIHQYLKEKGLDQFVVIIH